MALSATDLAALDAEFGAESPAGGRLSPADLAALDAEFGQAPETSEEPDLSSLGPLQYIPPFIRRGIGAAPTYTIGQGIARQAAIGLAGKDYPIATIRPGESLPMAYARGLAGIFGGLIHRGRQALGFEAQTPEELLPPPPTPALLTPEEAAQEPGYLESIGAGIAGLVLDPIAAATFATDPLRTRAWVARGLARPSLGAAARAGTAFGLYGGETELGRQLTEEAEISAGEIAREAGSGILTGAAMGPLGGLPFPVRLPAEIGTLATIPAALESRIPTAEELADAAGIILGLNLLHAPGRIARGLKARPEVERAPAETQPEGELARLIGEGKPRPETIEETEASRTQRLAAQRAEARARTQAYTRFRKDLKREGISLTGGRMTTDRMAAIWRDPSIADPAKEIESQWAHFARQTKEAAKAPPEGSSEALAREIGERLTDIFAEGTFDPQEVATTAELVSQPPIRPRTEALVKKAMAERAAASAAGRAEELRQVEAVSREEQQAVQREQFAKSEIREVLKLRERRLEEERTKLQEDAARLRGPTGRAAIDRGIRDLQTAQEAAAEEARARGGPGGRGPLILSESGATITPEEAARRILISEGRMNEEELIRIAAQVAPKTPGEALRILRGMLRGIRPPEEPPPPQPAKLPPKPVEPTGGIAGEPISPLAASQEAARIPPVQPAQPPPVSAAPLAGGLPTIRQPEEPLISGTYGERGPGGLAQTFTTTDGTVYRHYPRRKIGKKTIPDGWGLDYGKKHIPSPGSLRPTLEEAIQTYGKVLPIQTKGVTPDAESLRSIERPIPPTGVVPQAGQVQGRPDIQRPPEARPETRGAGVSPEKVAPEAERKVRRSQLERGKQSPSETKEFRLFPPIPVPGLVKQTVGRTARWFFSPSMTVASAAVGRADPRLGRAFNQSVQNAIADATNIHAELSPALGRINRLLRTGFFSQSRDKAVAEMTRMHEVSPGTFISLPNALSEGVGHVFPDVPTGPTGAKVAAVLRQIWNLQRQMADIAERAGIARKGGVEHAFTEDGKVWLRQFTPDFFWLTDPEGAGPTVARQLAQKIVDFNASLGNQVSIDQALEYLTERNGVLTGQTGSAIRQNRALEDWRTIKYFPDMVELTVEGKPRVFRLTETDPLTYVNRAVQSFAGRVAVVQHFGQQDFQGKPVSPNKPRDHILPDLLKRLEDSPDAVRAVRDAIGTLHNIGSDPLDMAIGELRLRQKSAPGEGIISQLYAGAIDPTIKTLMTSALPIVQAFQTAGLVPPATGLRRFVRGALGAIARPKESLRSLQAAGAIVQALRDYSIRGTRVRGKFVPDLPIRDIGTRAIAQRLGRITTASMILNDMIAGNAARAFVADLKAGRTHFSDAESLRFLNYGESEIKRFLAGQATEAQYNELMRRVISKTQFTQLSAAERTGFQNTQWGRIFLYFQSYLIGSSQAASKLASNLNDALEARDPPRVAASTINLAKAIVGTSAAGLGTYWLKAFLFGRDPNDREWPEQITNGLSEYWISGIARQLVNDPADAATWDLRNFSAPARFFSHVANATAAVVERTTGVGHGGRDEFANRSPSEVAVQLLRSTVPLTRLQGGYLAALGLSDPVAISARNRYFDWLKKNERKEFLEIRAAGEAREGFNVFDHAIGRIKDAIRRGDQKAAEEWIGKAFDIKIEEVPPRKALQAVESRLRNFQILGRLSPEKLAERETRLLADLGEHTLEGIRRWDELIERVLDGLK
jgi:hypothetical protein